MPPGRWEPAELEGAPTRPRDLQSHFSRGHQASPLTPGSFCKNPVARKCDSSLCDPVACQGHSVTLLLSRLPQDRGLLQRTGPSPRAGPLCHTHPPGERSTSLHPESRRWLRVSVICCWWPLTPPPHTSVNLQEMTMKSHGLNSDPGIPERFAHSDRDSGQEAGPAPARGAQAVSPAGPRCWVQGCLPQACEPPAAQAPLPLSAWPLCRGFQKPRWLRASQELGSAVTKQVPVRVWGQVPSRHKHPECPRHQDSALGTHGPQRGQSRPPEA